MNESFRTAILNEMSDYVERVLSSGMGMFPGKRIEQIKYIRERTGFGLKDSKDIVETDDFDSRLRIIVEAIKGALEGYRTPPPPISEIHYAIGREPDGSRVVYMGHSLHEAERVMDFISHEFGVNSTAIARAV